VQKRCALLVEHLPHVSRNGSEKWPEARKSSAGSAAWRRFFGRSLLGTGRRAQRSKGRPAFPGHGPMRSDVGLESLWLPIPALSCGRPSKGRTRIENATAERGRREATRRIHTMLGEPVIAHGASFVNITGRLARMATIGATTRRRPASPPFLSRASRHSSRSSSVKKPP
jgi:hypothetical protein